MGSTNARVTKRVAALLALLLALALPSVALATTTLVGSPSGTILVGPPTVGVAVTSTDAALNASTAGLKIDGISYANPQITALGSITGTWSYSETLINGTYVGRWTWTAGKGAANQGAMYAWASPAAKANGSHNCTATINGTTVSWTYTVAVPAATSFTSVSPADGSTSSNATPTFVLGVSADVTSVDLTINGGTPVTGLVPVNRVVTYTVPAALAAPSSVSVSAVAHGAVNVTKNWGFAITAPAVPLHAAPADAASTACLACHAGLTLPAIHAGCACHSGVFALTPAQISAAAAASNACGACHTDTSHSIAHAASPAPETITISGVAFGTHACTECHASTNLIPLHGSLCATCHPTPKDSVAGIWAKGCVQGGCHTSGSTRPMHVSIDSVHAVPADKAACLASGCHDAGAITPFTGKSVADLHSAATTSVAGVTRASCQICHAPGVVPTTNCTSVGCHADRANAHGYDAGKHTASLSTASYTINGAAYGPFGCNECHAVELGPEHAKSTSSSAASGCSACHPTPSNTLAPWSKTSCAQGNCHAGSSPDPQHGGIDSAHPTLPASDCSGTGCHSGDLASIHAGASKTVDGHTRTSCMVCHAGGAPTSINWSNGVAAACQSCHGDTWGIHFDFELHTAVPAPQDITISGVSFGSFACAECHQLDIMSSHNGGDCATCHPTPKDSVAGTWAKGCVQGGCHTSGSTRPMHVSIDSAHAIPADKAACLASGCHDAGAITPFAGKSAADLHSAATTSVAGVTRSSCQICHAPGVTPTTNCTSVGCHADRANAHGYDAGKHTGSPTAQSFTIAGQTYPAVACANCHSTELGVEHTKATSAGNTGCAECHPTLVKQLTPSWDKTTCAQDGCHTLSSAAPMHGAITAAHTPLASNNACFASGCHADGSLADTHSQATTTVAGTGRSSCMVCHAVGIPVTKDCGSCHTADGVDYHTSQSTMHASPTIVSCFGAGCHGASRSLPDVHARYVGPGSKYSQYTTTCELCHKNQSAGRIDWAKATAGCVSCHPLYHGRPTGAPVIHSGRDTAHTPTAASAGCTGCHSGTLSTIHGAYETAQSDCLSCHMVHSGWNAACDKCHASKDNWSKTADCSSCHSTSSPHGDNVATHQASPGSGDIEMNMRDHDGGSPSINEDCSLCHYTNLLDQHSSNCSTCHSGAAPAAGLVGSWTKTCQQGACHPTFHTLATTDHFGAYRNSSSACEKCHTPTSDYPGPADACSNCHDPAYTVAP